MYILCTHSVGDDQDATANRWAWRRKEGERMMDNLREALPNVMYHDRDNHVIAAFEEPFFRCLRNEPLEAYTMPEMSVHADFLAKLCVVDTFLRRQYGYQRGKEFRACAKVAELYKHIVAFVRRKTVAMITGPGAEKKDAPAWWVEDILPMLTAEYQAMLEFFVHGEGVEPRWHREFLKELRMLSEAMDMHGADENPDDTALARVYAVTK